MLSLPRVLKILLYNSQPTHVSQMCKITTHKSDDDYICYLCKYNYVTVTIGKRRNQNNVTELRIEKKKATPVNGSSVANDASLVNRMINAGILSFSFSFSAVASRVLKG